MGFAVGLRFLAGLGLAAALAASGPGENRWIPVLVGPAHVAQAESIEIAIQRQADRHAPKGAPWFTVARGTAPILVTAPHVTKSLRKGQYHLADRGTGALAAMLHEVAGATVLYTTRTAPCDANDADSCEFKDTLLVLLKEIKPALVLDLHASSAERPYDIDFGTMRGASVKNAPALFEQLSDGLARSGLVSQSLDFFKAEQQQTVTKFVAAQGVPCIQLEINAAWLRPDGESADRHRFAQVLNGLAVFIKASADSSARKSIRR